MVPAVEHSILDASDHHQVRVVSVAAWEPKVHVEFLGDAAHTTALAADDTWVHTSVNLHQLTVQSLLQVSK